MAPLGLALNNQFFLPTVNGLIAFSLSYLHIRIISKERTEGGLNKRASPCALLFSTLLVFPNWTKSRPVYGDLKPHLSTDRQIIRITHKRKSFDNSASFRSLGHNSPLPPVWWRLYLVPARNQALFFLCINWVVHTWYDTWPPQCGHTVTSFLYRILIACTLSLFRNFLRNSRQPIRFLQIGISLRLLWLLRIP